MRNRWLVVSSIITAAATLPTAAIAQEAVPLDGVVVTTSKTPKKAVDAPAPASSKGSSGGARAAPATDETVEFPATVASEGFGANGKSQFDRLQPGSVTDIVRDMPGVTSSVNPNDPAQSLNIRGLQDFGRVNVMVDGARQNFQRSGHNANGAFYLDPEFISTLDITRGPAANAYGSGAIGGVAAFTTRSVDDILLPGETSAVVQKTGIGSNGAGFLSSTSGGLRVGPNVDLFGQFVSRDTATYDNGDGDPVLDSGFDDYGGLGKIAVRPAAGHEFTATALLQRFDFVNSIVATSGAPGTRRDSDTEADTYTVGYTFRSPSNPLIDFSSKAYYTTTSLDQRDLNSTVVPTPFRSFEIETTGFDVFNTSRFATGVLGHRLTYGVDGFEDRVNVSDDYFTADLFTPSGERRVWGGFIEDEVKVTNWLRVIGALRYDAYELEGGGVESDGEHVSPKGTVAVTPFNGFEVYGTWAEGYRAPALTETLVTGGHPLFPGAPAFLPSLFTFVPNPGLAPEIGQNKELGFNLKYDNVLKRGDRFRGKFNIFRNDVEDFIDQVGFGPIQCFDRPPPQNPAQCSPQNFVPFTFLQYQNIANARIEGAEMELNYDWGGGFAILSGTHTQGRDIKTGLELSSIPPDRISGTLGFRFLNNRLVVGSRVHAVEARDSRLLALLSSPDYTLFDLFGSYQFNNWSALDVAINNITDERYNKYLDADDSAGLQARAALTVKFGESGSPIGRW